MKHSHVVLTCSEWIVRVVGFCYIDDQPEQTIEHSCIIATFLIHACMIVGMFGCFSDDVCFFKDRKETPLTL